MKLSVSASTAAVFVVVALLHAQIPDRDRALVEDYVGTVRSAESGKGSVEEAFAKVASVCRALARIDDDDSLIDALSEEDVRRLKTLPGIAVTDELSSARPDQQFFSTLAQTHGTAADRQFFQTLNFTSPPGQWAIYLEGASDFGACTKYGSGTLVEAYRRWAQFQRSFPDRYVRQAAGAIDGVAEELIRPTCACGDVASVTRELESFLRAFPSVPLSESIAATARALKANPSTVRTNCRPG
jgi:hypothetical protein